MENSDFERFNEFLEKRIEPSTKKNYKSAIKQLKKWLVENNPHSIQAGKIILPLEFEVLKTFLGKYMLKDPKNPILPSEDDDEDDDEAEESKKYKAPGTVSNMCSAIKNLYTDNKLIFPVDLAKEIMGFLNGLKKHRKREQEEGIISTVSEFK